MHNNYILTNVDNTLRMIIISLLFLIIIRNDIIEMHIIKLYE